MQTEYGLKYVRIRMDYKTGHIGLQTGDDPEGESAGADTASDTVVTLSTARVGMDGGRGG